MRRIVIIAINIATLLHAVTGAPRDRRPCAIERPGRRLAIIVGESAIIGVVSGTLGSLFAWLASLGVDWALEHVAPKFPFKPDSLFNFEWWIFASAIGLSILFCVLGGLLPALRASRLEPAAALAQN
jgi:ABC-type antimicrobial peptide transport system permease subunit